MYRPDLTRVPIGAVDPRFIPAPRRRGPIGVRIAFWGHKEEFFRSLGYVLYTLRQRFDARGGIKVALYEPRHDYTNVAIERFFTWDYDERGQPWLVGLDAVRRPISANTLSHIVSNKTEFSQPSTGPRERTVLDFSFVGIDGYVPRSPITRAYKERYQDDTVGLVTLGIAVPVLSHEVLSEVPALDKMRVLPAGFAKGYLFPSKAGGDESAILVGPEHTWRDLPGGVERCRERVVHCVAAGGCQRIVVAVDIAGNIIGWMERGALHAMGDKDLGDYVGDAVSKVTSVVAWPFKAVGQLAGKAWHGAWGLVSNDLFDLLENGFRLVPGGAKLAGWVDDAQRGLDSAVAGVKWTLNKPFELGEAIGIPKEVMVVGACVVLGPVALGAVSAAGFGSLSAFAMDAVVMAVTSPAAPVVGYLGARKTARGIARKIGIPPKYVDGVLRTIDSVTLSLVAGVATGGVGATLGPVMAEGGREAAKAVGDVAQREASKFVAEQVAQLGLDRVLVEFAEKTTQEIADKLAAFAIAHVMTLQKRLQDDVVKLFPAMGPLGVREQLDAMLREGMTYAESFGQVQAFRGLSVASPGSPRTSPKAIAQWAVGAGPHIEGVTFKDLGEIGLDPRAVRALDDEIAGARKLLMEIPEDLDAGVSQRLDRAIAQSGGDVSRARAQFQREVEGQVRDAQARLQGLGSLGAPTAVAARAWLPFGQYDVEAARAWLVQGVGEDWSLSRLAAAVVKAQAQLQAADEYAAAVRTADPRAVRAWREKWSIVTSAVQVAATTVGGVARTPVQKERLTLDALVAQLGRKTMTYRALAERLARRPRAAGGGAFWAAVAAGAAAAILS